MCLYSREKTFPCGWQCVGGQWVDGSYLNKANLALAPLEFGNYTITIYHEVKCNTRRKKTQAETELCQAKILIFPNLRSYNFQSFPNSKNLPCPSIFIWNAFLREHDKKICVKFGSNRGVFVMFHKESIPNKNTRTRQIF